MAYRPRAISRDRLSMLRAVLDKTAAGAGIARGTKDHEALAVQLLQLEAVIPEEARLTEALRQGAVARGPGQRGAAAEAPDTRAR